jgi:hypothetical protein
VRTGDTTGTVEPMVVEDDSEKGQIPSNETHHELVTSFKITPKESKEIGKLYDGVDFTIEYI